MNGCAFTQALVPILQFLKTALEGSVGANLRALPLVENAEPMIFNLMDLTPEVNALVFGWRAESYELDSLTLLSGRRFRDGQPEVMLGDALAGNLSKKTGDSLEIQGTNFSVVGIYHGGSALEADAVVMPLDELQQLSSLQGKVAAFHVHEI